MTNQKTMRRLIIITNNGGEGNYLGGVAVDRQNYLDFFQLPEGGLWEAGEIQSYDNFCTLGLLRSYLISCSLHSRGQLDYVVLVFCGHGYTNQYGNQIFELSPGNEASLQDIINIMQHTRCLMIADCCRTIVRLDEGGVITSRQRMFTESRESDDYKQECRRIYDMRFKQMTIGSICLGRAASLNQAANENSNTGGYYSHALLESARDVIAHKKSQARPTDYCPVSSFPYIHNMAAQKVIERTRNGQQPVCDGARWFQPPFVVVA